MTHVVAESLASELEVDRSAADPAVVVNAVKGSFEFSNVAAQLLGNVTQDIL